MVHITYRHGAYSTKGKRVIFKEYHFYIIDDICHDLDFVQHKFQFFYNHLEDKNMQMEQHWIWSDGCAGQFKNSRVFQWLCILHKRHKVPHIWNYFETGHEKWEHDGVGACIKTALRRQEVKFTTILLIRDAKTIVAWCSSMMGRELEGKKTNHLTKHMYIDIFGRWSM